MSVRLAVLGSPVAHSLSPAIHRAAMEALGIEGEYLAREVDADEMSAVAEEVRSGRLLGASVTMPHKGIAAALADAATESVTTLSSANTWWSMDGRLHADATDGDGVRFAWDRARLPMTDRVRILGAGGAAAAAALELQATHEVRVSARRAGAAEDVAARVGCDTAMWGEAVSGEVVVNATSIGMQGDSLPSWALASPTGYLEMVYAVGITPTAASLALRGVPVASALDMLVGQAVRAFEHWFGVTPPVDVMLEAAKASSAP